MKKLLFVCLGNICRSPAAEAIMQHIIEQKGKSQQFVCDSAGTASYHVGEKADSRMRQHASRRGYQLLSRGRQFTASDFQEFDYIFTMDDSNFRNVCVLDPHQKYQHKIFPIVQFCQNHQVNEVPDPYFGGEQGFEQVLNILEDACEGIWEKFCHEAPSSDKKSD